MKKTWMVFLVILASNPVFASTLHWAPVIAVGGGITNTINLGESDTFPVTNPSTDQYYHYSSASQQTKGLFEIFLGVESLLSKEWLLQFGSAYTQSATFSPEGEFVQGANEYNYQYDLTTRQIMVQTKLMRRVCDRFYPYVLFGLGAAFNTASDYTTTVPYTHSYTRLYAENTSTEFTYRIGAGLDVDLGHNLRLGIAYRIADLGGYSLGQATIDQKNVADTLSQSTLYANEVLVQLTYHL